MIQLQILELVFGDTKIWTNGWTDRRGSYLDLVVGVCSQLSMAVRGSIITSFYVAI